MSCIVEYLNKRIRLQLICGLILLSFSCSQHNNEERFISFQWEDGKPTHLYIPLKILNDPTDDSIGELLDVRLVGAQSSILGQYDITDDAVLFFPLISFTEGLNYVMSWRGKILDTLMVPVDSARKDPTIISIYPNVTELPENLLKVHIEFSKPMQEGHSMKYISVIKDGKDTVPVFLEMKPELWNAGNTTLTLWLDPGRIKRGLQPNEKTGTPLEKGQHYELLIRSGWPDQEGRELGVIYSKHFQTTARDSISPDVKNWTIHAPSRENVWSLKIYFNEPLDYMLLNHVFSITDHAGRNIAGQFLPRGETEISFIPEQKWIAGEYFLNVESRLEDLAGNNMERLFDEDLSRAKPEKTDKKIKLAFRVK